MLLNRSQAKKVISSVERVKIDWWIGGGTQMKWQWIMKARAAFICGSIKNTNRETSKRSDQFKGPQHEHLHTVAIKTSRSIWAIVFAHFGLKMKIDEGIFSLPFSGDVLRFPSGLLCDAFAVECKKLLSQWQFECEREKTANGAKISYNHSIGMTINGRNLLCGFSVESPTNPRAFYGETMMNTDIRALHSYFSSCFLKQKKSFHIPDLAQTKILAQHSFNLTDNSVFFLTS